MPELPEVETIVRDLRPLLVGRRIASVRLGEKRLRRSSGPLQPDSLIGRRFHSLTRRGKKQLESEAANWQRLSSAISHIIQLSEV